MEGAWNTARIEEPNLGYKPSFKGGYFPVSPTDTYHDLRGEMVYEMRKIGIVVEAHHHEVATAGQSEIDMKFEPLVKMADQFMWYKYICKNVAKRHGKTVTFMPKPIFEDNGSGMHTHTSLWKGGKPLFAGDGYAGLSELGLWAAGGLLKHAPAILAFAAPTTNSYRRLVPGFEAPVNLALSARNRSAAIRIPMYSKSPKAKRLEFRCPDPSCNGYLAWSAMLMAMIDGIQNKVRPGRAARSRHLRDDARRDEGNGDPDDPRLARRGHQRARGGSRVPAARRRLHRGSDPDLDRLEAVEGTRPDPAPPASARVLPVLRQLIWTTAARSSLWRRRVVESGLF